MRTRPVLIWSLAWLALFLVFTWAGSYAFAEVTIQDTFTEDSRLVYDVWWGRTLQFAAVIATAFVGGGLVLMVWFRRQESQSQG